MKSESYILAIDQSTQGTKAILTDVQGNIVGRCDKKHRQIISAQGWISHDPDEIFENVKAAAALVVEKTGINKNSIKAIGISNQRETTVMWHKDGTADQMAVVWQCDRAKEITESLAFASEMVREKTGLPLSPFFPASKMAWLIKNTESEDFLLGTMDAYLVYRLTDGKVFKTDYSNASRTQLFNLHTLKWDQDLCRLFGVPLAALPEVTDSNGDFGSTTLDGYFESPVPICAVLGDSHGALFAHGCHEKGMVKATYGTGSSIMMNTGSVYKKSRFGLASSLAWGIDGEVSYVLEGNINYTGAVVSWLEHDLSLIESPKAIELLIKKANMQDETVFVPAFSGLSAPYWDNDARAMVYGMSRTTGKAEFVKAALESIAFQITDVLRAMESDSGIKICHLQVDGGPTANAYLMQFQSDMAGVKVQVPDSEEFSALGAAYMAGIKAGMYQKDQIFSDKPVTEYKPVMAEKERAEKLSRWKYALHLCMQHQSYQQKK